MTPTPLTSQPWFDGATFDLPSDGARLKSQLVAVYRLMFDGQWRTLREIADALGGQPEASVSARLRDLRKDRFGGFSVERRRRGEGRGLFEYRLAYRQEVR